jgi:Arc/MetJ-type ribon-helix-helix transcriptional regulator
MPRDSEGSVSYVTVSIPLAIADGIDEIIRSLGYWPSRSSFVREACLEKIRLENNRVRELGVNEAS